MLSREHIELEERLAAAREGLDLSLAERAMGIVGIVGYAYMRDWSWTAAFATVQTKLYETGRNYTLSVIPLFILMGNFVTRAGMSQELYRAAYAFIGHLRGGLAMATVAGATAFKAICGSSPATAATSR